MKLMHTTAQIKSVYSIQRSKKGFQGQNCRSMTYNAWRSKWHITRFKGRRTSPWQAWRSANWPV